MADESGWLIENGSLALGVRCGKLTWVVPGLAIRFARREDADATALGLRGSLRDFPETVSAEHLWCEPPREGETEERHG